MTKTKTLIAALIIAAAAAFIGLTGSSDAENGALHLAWSVETNGNPINFAPVLAGDKVLTIPHGGDLLAFDAASGDKAWTFAPAEGVWERSIASDGARAFVCLRGGKLAALNSANGDVLWTAALGIDCQRAPLVSGDTLYVPSTFVGPDLPNDTFTGAKLFSVNAADGHINWETPTDNYLLQVPAFYGDTVYVGGSFRNLDVAVDEGGHARFYAMDAHNGEVKWTYESQDGTPKGLYATKDRMIYVGYQDFLVALDTKDGSKVWRRDTGNWVPSLSGMGDTVYYGAANTLVHAWDTVTGDSRWVFNIPTGSFNYLLGKPAFEEGRVYFTSQLGTIFALDQASGELLWSHQSAMKTPRIGITVKSRMIYMGDAKGKIFAYKVMK